MIIEPERFRDFERAGWESIPGEYHQAFGRLTIQAVGALLDAVGVKKGVNLLDIATGPGYVASAAAKRGAVVVGVDFSPAMVAEARKLDPGVDFAKATPRRYLSGMVYLMLP